MILKASCGSLPNRVAGVARPETLRGSRRRDRRPPFPARQLSARSPGSPAHRHGTQPDRATRLSGRHEAGGRRSAAQEPAAAGPTNRGSAEIRSTARRANSRWARGAVAGLCTDGPLKRRSSHGRTNEFSSGVRWRRDLRGMGGFRPHSIVRFLSDSAHSRSHRRAVHHPPDLTGRSPVFARSGCGILRRWLHFEPEGNGGGSQWSPRRWSRAWARSG